MKRRTIITRIGTVLLACSLMLGGAVAPATAYAESGESVEVFSEEMPEVETEPGQESDTVSSGDAESVMKDDVSDEEIVPGEVSEEKFSADDMEPGHKTVSDGGAEDIKASEDGESIDGTSEDEGTSEGDHDGISDNATADDTASDEKASAETGDDPDSGEEVPDAENFDDGWEEVDESDLPPDENVMDTIDMHIEEIEEMSEDSVLDSILESKVILPERVLMANAAAKSTDKVVGDLIDLTDIFTGEAASHECENYLRENHDEEHHWKECAVCGKKYGIEHHDFTTMGDDSCAWWNAGQTRYCEECGYITVYKRAHVDDTSKWYTRVDAKWHYHKCDYCDSYGSVNEACRDKNGNVIKCDGGTCAVCGYTYGKGHTYFNNANGESGTVYCGKCGDMMLTFDSNTGYWAGDNVYKASIRITGWNKEIFGNDAEALAETLSVGGTGGGVTGDTSDLTTSVRNGYIYASCTISFPYEDRGASWANEVWSVQPYSTRICVACNGGRIENRAPEIKSAKITYASKNGEYSTKATLAVSCTDHWVYEPNYVQVRLVDDKKEPTSDWVTCAKSGTTFSQTIDLVTEASGNKTFYVQARDAGGNVSEKQVTLANLDSKAPVVTSALTTTEDWSKMKTITFTCTDEGVGDVKIAFNNQSDYQKADFDGTTYSRSYTFTGDVYGSARAAVYFMDGAGNTTTEFVEIYNLDNTEPVISMTDVSDAINASGEAYGWNVKAEGNDDNTKLSKTGSGIIGYALTKDDTEPEDTAYQSDKTLFIGRSGKYYLWVKDGAGNVTRSDDQIVIHSDYYFNGREVNAITCNGKEITSFYYNGKRIRL